jgi:DhnA family fructose-bisphosphate aldolase class Ia
MTATRLLSRILGPDGRTVILALDAPAFTGDIAGVDGAVAAVPQMAAVGLNCVLVPKGIALRQSAALQDVGMVLRCDTATDVYDGSIPDTFIVNDALDAVKSGADGVVVMGFPGHGDNVQLQLQTAALYRGCREYGLPLIVEALPFSFVGAEDSHRDPRNVATAVRLAAEYGADIVKTRYSGTAEDKLIAETATVPVVALGGPKTGLEGYLRFVDHCVRMGAAGVAVGRNIVQDPFPVAKVAALAAIIHGEAAPTDALAMYNELAR